MAAQAGAEESGGVRAGQAVCEERRAGGVDGVQAELRSRILLQSSAAALSISPAEIATVRVTELGAVDVRGTLEPDREHRLEAVLQANREFLSLYREVRERWESGAVEVATAMQSYA